MADDILVFGKEANMKEAEVDHDQNLHKLIERCKKTTLKLNKDKMKLKMTELRYCGHVITDQGIKANPEKNKSYLTNERTIKHKGFELIFRYVKLPCKIYAQIIKEYRNPSWSRKKHSMAMDKEPQETILKIKGPNQICQFSAVIPATKSLLYNVTHLMED